MMKSLLLFLTLFSVNVYSQNIWAGAFAKEWNKEFSVFYSNEYLTKNIFKSKGENVLKFQTEALAASNSGEITTVLYRTEDNEIEGLLLCFYGSRWNDAGVVYTGYGFKNFDREKAFSFLNILQKNLDEHKDYLTQGGTTAYSGNNIFFKFEDISIIMGYMYGALTIRLFWDTYDSTWNINAFEKSKRRFEKRTK